MAKSLKKTSICFVLAIALAFTMIPLAAQPAKAATANAAMGAGKTITLSQGVDTLIDFGSTSDFDYNNDTYYFKINPTKTGTITLSGNAAYPVSGYVSLCNASKKVISKDSKKSKGAWFWSDSSTAYFRTVHFGVKKGKTYYIRIADCSPKFVYEVGNYKVLGTLKWTNKAVKNIKYGKTKKKALTIKRNKKKAGVIKAGSKKPQWYKINVNKKSAKIYLTSTKNCGKIKADVYYRLHGSYGKWMKTTIYAYRDGAYYYSTISGTTKVRRVYIKVYPGSSTSGAYTLKWK